MKWFKANWFAVIVAATTIFTSVSSVVTDWLAEGWLWSFLPPLP